MAHKRPFEGDDEEYGQSEKKPRLSLPSVVKEAVRANNLQKFWAALEPLLRRVVNEEVERVLANFVPARLGLGPSPMQLPRLDARNLRLQFRNKLALPLFTGSKVEGDQGGAIEVVLLDVNTGYIVNSGEEASAKLDIVVLEGDFSKDDGDDWTQAEFTNYVVKEREGKRPLLTGELTVTLKDGVGSIGELIFTDNSSWIRSRKFRIGVKISPGCCEGMRIREAKTEAFNVKDHRGELYKKHYPPSLDDEVWRLEKIGKDGAYHKRLIKESITTVQDFLILYSTQPQKLREIIGSNVSNKLWESILDHANTCILNDKRRVYYPEGDRRLGVIFDTIYHPLGILTNGAYLPIDTLSETVKVHVDTLVQDSYKDLRSIIDYGGEVTGGMRPQHLERENTYREGFDNQTLHLSNSREGLDLREAAEHSHPMRFLGSPLTVSGGEFTSSYDQRPQSVGQLTGEDLQLSTVRITGAHMNAEPSSQVFSATYPQNVNRMPSNTLPSLFSFGSSQASLPSVIFSPPSESLEGTMIANDYSRQRDLMHNDQDTFYNSNGGEGESPGETEDLHMQFFHAIHPAAGDQSISSLFSNQATPDVGIRFDLPPPADFSGPRGRLPGRGYIGWIKLKAALKWGMSYKRTAASRQRAQIQELD